MNSFLKTVLITIPVLLHLDSFAQRNNRPTVPVPNGFEVNSYTGNLYHGRTDMKIPGQGLNIDVSFSYNATRRTKNAGYGKGWTFKYNLSYAPDATGIWIEREDGKRDLFTRSGNLYASPVGVYETLTQYQPDKFLLTTKEGLKFYFDNASHKRLTKLEDRNANMLTLAYTDSLISTLTDAGGHRLQFTWTAGMLTEINDNTCTPFRKFTYAYDTAKNLVKATDPLNNFVAYYYDAANRIVGYMDENGYKMSFVYDANSAVAKVVSCITTHTFSYLASQNKIFVTEDVSGQKQVTSYQYDASGRVTTKKGNCCGYNVDYTYDASNNVREVKDGMGTSTKFEYDGKGNVIKETHADGSSVSYTYEPQFNRVASIKDKNGNTTSYQHDALGNITQINKPLGVTEKFSYDVKGNVTSHTDGNNNVTAYEYNGYGYLLKTTDAEGGITQSTYDCHGNRVTEADALNNVTAYEYDALNHLTKVTDALGNHTLYAYDKIGNIVSITNPLGNNTLYVYDGLGRRISTTTPLGIKQQNLYDEQGDMIKAIDGNGNSKSYTYNSRKQVLTETDPLGNMIAYQYDEAGNRTSVKDKRGGNTKMIYNEVHKLKEIINSIGNKVKFNYDNVGNRTVEIDAKGNATLYTYNELNQLMRVTDPRGKSIFYSYDGNGNRLTEKNKSGYITIYTYDKLNRLKTIVDPDKAIKAYTYDANGNIVEETDPLSNTNTMTYDKLNRQLTKSNALNETTIYTYNAYGKITKIELPNGNTILNLYDNDSRLITVSDEIGTVISYTYDNKGNKLTEKDPNNNVVTFKYDQMDRLIQKIDALNNSNAYLLDANSNILSETDRNGNTRMYAYNSFNQRISESDALQNTTKFTYDANGNRINIEDAKGNPTSYNYDVLNQLIRETYANGSSKEYTYDDAGNRKTRKDNNGVITTYVYDAVDRMIKRNYADGNADEFTYDLAGRKVLAKNANAIINYTYDKVNRVLSEELNGNKVVYSYNTTMKTRTVAYPGGKIITETRDVRDRLTAIQEGANNTATFTYDAADRLKQKLFNNGYSVIYAYNNNDWLIGLTCQPNDLINFEYQYDNEGNRTSALKKHRVSHSERYIYDNLYRLTHFYNGRFLGNNLSDTISKDYYTYDALHNRVTSSEENLLASYSTNIMNAYTKIVTNGITSNYIYDNNGNTIKDEANTYSYDSENRLLKVNNGIGAHHYYDPLGRRIKSIFSNKSIIYCFDGDRIIEERNNANQVQKTYVFGAWLDDVLTYTQSSLSKTFYVINNHQGSVLAVLDTNGLVERYEYNGYGRTKIYNSSYNEISTSLNNNVVGFTGRPFDLDNNFYDYRSRLYNDRLGRFNTVDELGYVDGYNLYHAYFAPNFIDPYGTSVKNCNRINISTNTFKHKANKLLKSVQSVLPFVSKLQISGLGFSGSGCEEEECCNGALANTIELTGEANIGISFEASTWKKRLHIFRSYYSAWLGAKLTGEVVGNGKLEYKSGCNDKSTGFCIGLSGNISIEIGGGLEAVAVGKQLRKIGVQIGAAVDVSGNFCVGYKNGEWDLWTDNSEISVAEPKYSFSYQVGSFSDDAEGKGEDVIKLFNRVINNYLK